VTAGASGPLDAAVLDALHAASLPTGTAELSDRRAAQLARKLSVTRGDVWRAVRRLARQGAIRKIGGGPGWVRFVIVQGVAR